MEKTKKKKFELGHCGQILTTRDTLRDFMNEIDRAVSVSTVCLISDGLRGEVDYLRLYAVCARLYYLSKLVYKRKTGVAKLSAEGYRHYLFDGFAETEEEVRTILQEADAGEHDAAKQDEHIEQVFRCLLVLEKLWCRAIACVTEQVCIPELAYSFEYVIERKGEIAEPEFAGTSGIFPINYNDYDAFKPGNVREYFEQIAMGIF